MTGLVTNISADVLNEIINTTLPTYVKELFDQNIDDRPLLKGMREKQKEFAGGPDIRLNVKGNYGANGQWLEDDGPVAFRTTSGTQQAIYPWYAAHDGIEIGYTALKAAGFSVGDEGDTTEHSNTDVLRITNFLETQYSDLDESMPITIATMLLQDGTQSAAQSPGLPFFLSDTPTTGTIGGISRAANSFWRNRALVGANKISYSAANQTLTQTLVAEALQLRRKGGKPDMFPAGSQFIKALQIEAYAKGQLTLNGFNKSNTDVGLGDISILGLGKVFYEPLMDDLGLQDRMYAIDSSKIGMYVMQNEEFKVHMPDRPYDTFKIYKSITWTGALTAKKLNSSGVYQVNNSGL